MRKISTCFLVFSLLVVSTFSFGPTYSIKASTNEETYQSRAELQEYLAEAIKTCGHVSLDAYHDLYYRHPQNIIPEKIDLGGTVKDLRIEKGKAGDSGTTFAYLEDGRMFALTGDTQTEDAKTPYISNWTDIGVPMGATYHSWVTQVDTNSSSSSQSSSYGYSSSTSKNAIGQMYLFYLTSDGTIEFCKQGTVSRFLGSYYNSSSSGGSQPAGSWHGGSSSANNTKQIVPPPIPGLKFTYISIPFWQKGGYKDTASTSEEYNSSEIYNIQQTLPTIYATDENGELWVASAVKTLHQTYKRRLVNYNWQVIEGAPINKNIPEITPNDYVWTKTDRKQVWAKQSVFAEEQNADTYDIFAIKSDNHLYRINSSGNESAVLPDITFSEHFENFGYSFLVDSSGMLYFCPDNGSISPVPLFHDADVENILTSITSTDVAYGNGTGGETRTWTSFTLFDSKNRVWRFTWETHRISSVSSYSSSQSYRYSLTTPTLSQTFPARVKKIETQMLTGYDSDYGKNKTSYGAKQESTLYLLENGEIWACGCNVNHEDMWMTSQSIGCHGYYCMIGPYGNYNIPTKVSGDIYFVDVVHKTNYSLAIDENGTVYRTGHYMEDKGDLVSADTYNPAEYNGFTPVEATYEYGDSNIFLAGYRYIETIYDNMFTPNKSKISKDTSLSSGF